MKYHLTKKGPRGNQLYMHMIKTGVLWAIGRSGAVVYPSYEAAAKGAVIYKAEAVPA